MKRKERRKKVVFVSDMRPWLLPKVMDGTIGKEQ